MSTHPTEPAFGFFSHVRKAVGAIGLAALGAIAMIGVLPLIAQPPAETAAAEPAEALPKAVLDAKPARTP